MAKEKVTKSEAIRRALAEGLDKPDDGVDWIKAQYGIDVTRQAYSQMKSNLKRKGQQPTAQARASIEPWAEQTATGNGLDTYVSIVHDLQGLAVKAGGWNALRKIVDSVAQTHK